MKTLNGCIWLMLVLGPAPALAAQGNPDAVFVYAEAGNDEGGSEGLGYSIDVSRTLSTPSRMQKGLGLSFSDVGTEVKVKASAGRFQYLSNMGTTWDRGPTTLTRAYSDDTVVAWAPGVAAGEPIVYTAKIKVSASTSMSPPGVPYNTASFSANLCLGNRCSPGIGLTGCESADVILKVKYTAIAGEEMDIYGSMQGFTNAVNQALPTEPALTTVTLHAPTRIILTADKPGANITGRSGHVYD